MVVTGSVSLAIGEVLSDRVAGILLLLFTATGFLYLIDFLTLSSLKRIKWKWFFYFYFPFYRLYGFITLAFLYRPLYYNLIDNKFGRRIGWFFVPYVLFLPFLIASKFTGHEYLPRLFEGQKTNVFIHENMYNSLRNDVDLIRLAAIPEKVIASNYLELFLVYEPEDNATIENECPDLEKITTRKFLTPVEYIATEMISWGDKESDDNKNFQTYVYCTSQLFDVHLDSMQVDVQKSQFYLHPESEQVGLLVMIDVRKLEKGKHVLNVIKKRKIPSADIFTYLEVNIPFWN